MPKKLLLSEAFADGSEDIVITTRVPKSLHSLLEKGAQEQGTSISTLVRGLLNYHYLSDHLKSKLMKKQGELTSNEVGLLESLRSHTLNVVNQLDEIDALRGQANSKGLKGRWLEKLIEKKIDEVMAHKKKGGIK